MKKHTIGYILIFYFISKTLSVFSQVSCILYKSEKLNENWYDFTFVIKNQYQDTIAIPFYEGYSDYVLMGDTIKFKSSSSCEWNRIKSLGMISETSIPPGLDSTIYIPPNNTFYFRIKVCYKRKSLRKTLFYFDYPYNLKELVLYNYGSRKLVILGRNKMVELRFKF